MTATCLDLTLSSEHPCARLATLGRDNNWEILLTSAGLTAMVASCISCWWSQIYCCISSTQMGTKSSHDLCRPALAPIAVVGPRECSNSPRSLAASGLRHQNLRSVLLVAPGAQISELFQLVLGFLHTANFGLPLFVDSGDPFSLPVR